MLLNICSTPEVLSVFRLVKIIINVIKIAVPIILIISVMLRYAKAITTNDNDLLAKANKVVVKQAIAAALIFLIPTIINVLVTINEFDTNSYMSCLSNATLENIDAQRKKIAEEYIRNLSENYSDSEYTNVKMYINKVHDESIKQYLIDQLDNVKKTGKSNISNGSSNELINRYVNEAIKIADDNSHGYCNKSNCNSLNPDVDCGTFVKYSLINANVTQSGTLNPNNYYKANSYLSKYGFKMHSFNNGSSSSELEYGDILHCNGHMAIYVGNNKIVAAHNPRGHYDSNGNILKGDQDGNEVSVTNFYLCGEKSNIPWLVYFRLEN